MHARNFKTICTPFVKVIQQTSTLTTFKLDAQYSHTKNFTNKIIQGKHNPKAKMLSTGTLKPFQLDPLKGQNDAQTQL